MNKTKLLLGVCCLTALMACNKVDSVSGGPHPMTITLSRGDAGTKTAFTVNGENLDRTWKTGDAVTAIYQYPTGTYNREKFELVSGAGTTTATFQCAASSLPMDQLVNVHIRYPYSDSDTWDATSGDLTSDISNQGSGSLADLGKYALLRSTKTSFKFFTIDSGVWDVKPLEDFCCFLHIPAGTQFLTGASGTDSFSSVVISSTEDKIKNTYGVDLKNNLIYTNDGSITLSNITLTDGKNNQDIYVGFNPASGLKELTFTCTLASNSKDYVYTLNRTSSLYAGELYHLGAAFTAQAK